MESIKLPSEEDVRTIYRREEDAMVVFVRVARKAADSSSILATCLKDRASL
jgi:hypothetical protein